jgi:cation-transporting ATPase 13A3/4/5
VRDLPNVAPGDVHGLKRGELERDLRFVGLLVLENKLKDETIDVVRELHEANIGVLMITGDNVHTAVTVGRSML